MNLMGEASLCREPNYKFSGPITSWHLLSHMMLADKSFLAALSTIFLFSLTWREICSDMETSFCEDVFSSVQKAVSLLTVSLFSICLNYPFPSLSLFACSLSILVQNWEDDQSQVNFVKCMQPLKFIHHQLVSLSHHSWLFSSCSQKYCTSPMHQFSFICV